MQTGVRPPPMPLSLIRQLSSNPTPSPPAVGFFLFWADKAKRALRRTEVPPFGDLARPAIAVVPVSKASKPDNELTYDYGSDFPRRRRTKSSR
jgi:hypothetical protein